MEEALTDLQSWLESLPAVEVSYYAIFDSKTGQVTGIYPEYAARDIENKIKGDFSYSSSEDVWEDIRKDAPKRFSGASYLKLIKNRSRGMQWPVGRTDTPTLHLENFRTEDGFGKFKYHQYKLREQVKKLLHNEEQKTFYLTTGRTIVHYNM